MSTPASSAPTRLAIIGLGAMGAAHARNVQGGKVDGLTLSAVCDQDASRCEAFAPALACSSLDEIIAAGAADAVLVATPHFSHPDLCLQALAAGLHVLVEKPIAVHKAAAERLRQVDLAPGQVFAAMFNQRTNPAFQAIHRMVHAGELGALRRIHWTLTDWFRTDTYYNSAGWRATWRGEGGGVLLNQSPHQLDLFCWMFGLPQKVRAFCRFGQYHDIEVEDEVTAYCEFASGASATFITSTGEAPGVNRLEIFGDLGRLQFEGNQLVFQRNDQPVSTCLRTSTSPWNPPQSERIEIPLPPATDTNAQHLAILHNFSDAMRNGAPLIAPAAEGADSVELLNAMLLSTWRDQTIPLPIDAAVYEEELNARIATSRLPAPSA